MGGGGLFGISPKDIFNRLKQSFRTSQEWEEDWLFYKGMQKEPQEGSMAGRDEVFAARKKNAEMRLTPSCSKNECNLALAVERETVEVGD